MITNAMLAEWHNVAGKDKTPAQLLAAHDAFMSGAALSDDAKATANAVFRAATFAAQAFDLAASHGMTRDGAPGALLRAFMIALIDPASAELDYLRADPSQGDDLRARLAAMDKGRTNG